MHRRRKYIRCPEGRSSFGSGFPIGASSIPVGTRFSVGKSSVLYLCGADGSRNCSTPREVWLQLRRSGGKGCPLRGSISDRKRLAGGASMHCLPAVSSAEQRYIKAPSAAAYYRIRTTTAVSRAGCPSPLPPPSLSTLAQMKMECCSNQRVLDSIGKPIAVQQIGLLSGVQLVQRHIQF